MASAHNLFAFLVVYPILKKQIRVKYMPTKINTRQNRQSNFELLRILAMLAIICFHFIDHAARYQLAVSPITNLLADVSFSKKLLLYQTVNTFGNTGNALFILITGYFLINSTTINLTKQIMKIFTQLFFGICFMVLVVFAFYFFHNKFDSFDIVSKLSGMFSINQSDGIYGAITFLNINSSSWFLGYYVGIVMLAKFVLNKWLTKATGRQFLMLIVCTASLISFNFFINLFNGITGSDHILRMITGVFFYMVGGYIRIYDPMKNIKSIAIIAVIAITYIFLFFSFYNNTMSNITKFKNEINTSFSQSLLDVGNASIFVVVIAIAVFELFKRINIGNIKIINFISSAVLMIYIVHVNEFMYSFYRLVNWTSLLYSSPIKALFVILIFGCIVFIFGFVVYLLYMLTSKIISKIATKRRAVPADSPGQ